MRLLLWEGHEQSKDGVHKSFSEMSDETGYSDHLMQDQKCQEARGGGGAAEGDARVSAGP